MPLYVVHIRQREGYYTNGVEKYNENFQCSIDQIPWQNHHFVDAT